MKKLICKMSQRLKAVITDILEGRKHASAKHPEILKMSLSDMYCFCHFKKRSVDLGFVSVFPIPLFFQVFRSVFFQFVGLGFQFGEVYVPLIALKLAFSTWYFFSKPLPTRSRFTKGVLDVYSCNMNTRHHTFFEGNFSKFSAQLFSKNSVRSYQKPILV